MTNPNIPNQCPENPTREDCGLAAARWLRNEQLIYIDFEEPNAIEQLALDDGEVIGVSWDNIRAGEALKLVGRRLSPLPVAQFDCKACGQAIDIEFGPFSSVNVMLPGKET